MTVAGTSGEVSITMLIVTLFVMTIADTVTDDCGEFLPECFVTLDSVIVVRFFVYFFYFILCLRKIWEGGIEIE